MAALDIEFERGKTVFAPGERVRGNVRWLLAEPAGSEEPLELSLFWYTEGRGTRDVGVVERIEIPAAGAFGSKDFDLALPNGPYTFSGKLISLIWAVELLCREQDEMFRREIIVSPTGTEILLAETTNQ